MWNVYRRYSQFYRLHRDLKKRESVVGTFYFPPKKHLGNKDGKFVDERRRKLQEYLRKVMNHTLQTNSILAAHPDKNLLISIFPFFGNGLLDPWYGGGVLKSLSDSLISVIIPEGAHHLDLRSSNPKDPLSVIKAREIEKEQIRKWIDQYHSQPRNLN